MARSALPAVALVLLSGCLAGRPGVNAALDRRGPTGPESPAEAYAIGCPDLLEVVVPGRPDCGGWREVGPDGRIDLGPLGKVRVQGETADAVAAKLAERAGRVREDVGVRVADYRSQHLYLFGEVDGPQRIVAYQGPETVVELLQRTGGLAPGAALSAIHVVRGHVADGAAPEVFQIDLRAIILDKDPRTNLRLRPLDQVYVGELMRSSVGKAVPPLLKPFFRALWWLPGGYKDPSRQADREARRSGGAEPNDRPE